MSLRQQSSRPDAFQVKQFTSATGPIQYIPDLSVTGPTDQYPFFQFRTVGPQAGYASPSGPAVPAAVAYTGANPTGGFFISKVTSDAGNVYQYILS
jgi:hypothetical protein